MLRNKIFSFFYIKNFLLILFIDTLVIDDEPLWEPLEWSLVQTWLLFIYLFTWSSEVIFSTKYGLYTNKDKTVWVGLFKTYWFLNLWFMFNIFIVSVFVTIPFYFEITYTVSYIAVWWNWYTSVFFFKFILLFTLLYILILNLVMFFRWVDGYLIGLVLFFVLFSLFFIFYFLFFIVFYGFFTDQFLFTKTSWFTFNKIINNFLKWDWGLNNRDHFAYHRTISVFWFKNDPLIASTMLFFNIFIFIFMFFFLIQLILVFRIYLTTRELSFNNIILFWSSCYYFYIFLLFLYFFIVLSFFYNLIRFPFELYWFNKVFFFFDFFFVFLWL